MQYFLSFKICYNKYVSIWLLQKEINSKKKKTPMFDLKEHLPC